MIPFRFCFQLQLCVIRLEAIAWVIGALAQYCLQTLWSTSAVRISLFNVFVHRLMHVHDLSTLQ